MLEQIVIVLEIFTKFLNDPKLFHRHIHILRFDCNIILYFVCKSQEHNVSDRQLIQVKWCGENINSTASNYEHMPKLTYISLHKIQFLWKCLSQQTHAQDSLSIKLKIHLHYPLFLDYEKDLSLVSDAVTTINKSQWGSNCNKQEVGCVIRIYIGFVTFPLTHNYACVQTSM